MPNILQDPEARSDLMRRIRSRNTTPELLVFREMRRRGIWFQRNYPRAPGSPDVARPRDRRAVFLDGDFWHGRELDRVRSKYGEDSDWVRKLTRNIERDREVDLALVAAGWNVLRVWESDIRRKATRQQAFDHIADFLLAARGVKAADTAPGAEPLVHTFEPVNAETTQSRLPKSD